MAFWSPFGSVAADYVEFTIRGEVRADRFPQAESTIHEKPNACR